MHGYERLSTSVGRKFAEQVHKPFYKPGIYPSIIDAAFLENTTSSARFNGARFSFADCTMEVLAFLQVSDQ